MSAMLESPQLCMKPAVTAQHQNSPIITQKRGQQKQTKRVNNLRNYAWVFLCCAACNKRRS